MKDELSIVIAVYNRERIVERTLMSVAAQTYSPLHVIVVDNGSTDGTYSVLEKWKLKNERPGFRITLLEEPRRGACAARNRGLSVVSSERMLFFDSDDTMRYELAEEYMRTFAGAPDADIAVCRCMLHRLDGSTFKLRYSSKPTLDDQLYHSVLRTQGYAVRTSFIKGAGGWNENLPVWNDWELGVRLLVARPVIATVDKTLVDTYQLEDSITGMDFKSKASKWEISLDAVDSILSKEQNIFPNRRLLVDYRRMVLAAHYKKEGADADAERLRRQVLDNTSSGPGIRLLLKAVYHYVVAGGRGASTIFRMFVR